MSEEKKPMPFAELVWYALSNIDVAESTEKKGQFDYLPWASAWSYLMNLYPESFFEFDEPAFFPNGTGEQWVTVTVKMGEDSISRRWWLPFLDYKNQPVTDPTALQINNTRMRVLVKCLAMLGLGTEVYTGEDVPEKEHDSKPTAVRKIVLEELEYDKEVAADWVAKLKEIMPSEDSIDQAALVAAYEGFSSLGDTTVAVFDGLTSWQRTAIKKVRVEIHESKRKAAVEKIQE